MIHVAEQSFYDLVNSKITNKAVFYELNCINFEEFNILKASYKNLPSPYPMIAYFLGKETYDYYAEAFGLSRQLNAINYNLPYKLVHADIDYEKATGNTFKIPTENELIKLLENKSKELIKQNDITNKLDILNSNDIILALKLIDDNNKIKIDWPKLCGEICNINSPKYLELEFYKTIIAPRDEILCSYIKSYLQNDIIDNFIVTYGAGHLAKIESFLLKLGFTPKINGEE